MSSVINMKCIVGLGNPGKEYEGTRHNMGFDVLDILEKRWNIAISKKDFKGLYGKGRVFDEDVILLKPQTYMNLSGSSVFDLVSYFHIDMEDLVIVYDDIDLPPGKIRIREKGSSGGQKGMQNIIDIFGDEEIQRIRVGTGQNPLIDRINYVLGKPTKEERELIDVALQKAADACECFVKFNFMVAKRNFS